MSSVAIVFVRAVRKRSQKVPRAKVGHLGSLGSIPMIQAPCKSSFDALQYETGTKFFHRAVPELHDIKTPEKSMHATWCFLFVLYMILDSLKDRKNESKMPSKEVVFLLF